MEFLPAAGVNDIYLLNFNEHYSITKASLLIKNLILGGLYIDLSDTINGINFQTNETCEITFVEKKDKINSHITGSIYDGEGKLAATISGSWLNQITMKRVNQNVEEIIWQEGPLVDNAHLQFYFNPTSVMLNYKNNDMKGHVAPTDSRWRGDLRLYEEGKVDESDIEKLKLEAQQRARRKQMEEGKMLPH